MSTPMPAKPLATIDGQWINIATRQEAVERVGADLRAGRGFSLHVLNLDHLVKRRSDPSYRAAYAKATYVTCDGAPVAALARRQTPGIARTSGPDLIEPLCRAAAEAGVSVYLFGSSAEVLDRVADELVRRCPGLVVAGREAPPQGFDVTSPAADAAIDRMVASGARLCLISLGSPKQEVLSRRALDRHPHLGLLNIGAGLDFIAGAQSRAPTLLRENGLEWLWRLASNPRRLGVRYAKCALVLADIIMLAPVRQRLKGAPPAGAA